MTSPFPPTTLSCIVAAQGLGFDVIFILKPGCAEDKIVARALELIRRSVE
jgi:hypothetical protein